MADADRPTRRPALFLDRDGTLIEDRGFVGDPDQVVFLPGAFEALRALQARFALFVVTNQGGIAAGAITPEQVAAVNQRLVDRLREAGVTIERVFVCPHAREDGCACIKPRPHFLRIAEREHGIDLGLSYTIGDHPHDADLGRNVGATGVFVLTGHGLAHQGELQPGHIILPSLREAARVISEDALEADHADQVAAAARILRRGGVVAFPTETVYGLGANALDPKAVGRIFELKRRPTFDPIIVHVDDPAWVDQLATCVPAQASELMRRFWPGPLTLVLPKRPLVPDLVTAGLETVAIRMPNHKVALSLIQKTGVPISAPSANPFGCVSPTTAEHVTDQLGRDLECVLDGGACAVGIESTIIGFAARGPVILRPGGVTGEALSDALGMDIPRASPGQAVIAPGMLARHYSPRTPVRLFAGAIPVPPTARAALVLLDDQREAPAGYVAVDLLSRAGDLAEIAHNLFASLRRLDKLGLDLIVAETAPEHGLGLAINDRLRRAQGHP